MTHTDQELKQAVERVLTESSRVDEHEVQVEVRDSVVHLTGAVDSTIEKRTARHLAEEVPGVKSVIDDLKVKNFVRMPDDELAAEVKNRLIRDAYVNHEGIEVYASQGEIQLDGKVPTYHMRKAAADVAWWTPGVINVENLLLVTDEEFVDADPASAISA
jgi:osmotically-inducible protein OsmY